MDRDPKRIARDWNREIDAETRRSSAEDETGGWGRQVVLALVALGWIVLILGRLGVLPRLL